MPSTRRGATRQTSAPATATRSMASIVYPGATASPPQRVELVGVGHAEFAADMKDRDAHREDRDKRVEQDAKLDEERRSDDGDRAQHEDAVFDHQVADNLDQCVAPADDQEQPDRDEEDRRLQHGKRSVAQRSMQFARESKGNDQGDNPE